MADKKKKGLLSRGISNLAAFFSPQSRQIQDIQSGGAGELSAALTTLGGYIDRLWDEDDKNKLLPTLPADRLSRYIEFDKMETDPICGRALGFHVENALCYDEDKESVVTIESRSNERDPVVAILKSAFHEWLQKHSKPLLYNVAKYGCWGVRAHYKMKGERFLGLDMESTEVCAEGHPSTWRAFYSEGRYLGVWSEYQDPNKPPMISMPGQFFTFKSPSYMSQTGVRLRRLHPTDPGYQHDIWENKPPLTIYESPDYGQSLFSRSYKLWKALEETCLALLLARLKSAQRETLVAYPISNQDPIEASKMINNLTATLQGREEEDAKRALREGLVQYSKKLVLPYDASGKGRIEMSQAEGNVNIEGIQDVMLVVKILCGSLGIDPSLVGFSDMLAGGLGEGGWFRTSLLALAYGNSLRQSLRNGLEMMLETEAYLRFGKIFTPQNKPWRLKFHTASSAKELEMGQVTMQRMDFAERLNGLFQSFEAGENGMDEAARLRMNVLLNNILKIDESVVADLLNPQKSGKGAKGSEEVVDDLLKNGDGGSETEERYRTELEETVNIFWENKF